METKFNFNSQVCTSKVQSERLLALGLKKETADCCYYYYDEEYLIAFAEDTKYPSDIPAWSLHRLMEITPDLIEYNHNTYIRQISKDSFSEETIKYVMSGCKWMHIGDIHDCDIYRAFVKCIEWLIKEGYFNKEYLV